MAIPEIESSRSEHRAPKSRAEFLREKVKIRLASDEAGQQISVVLAENGIVLQGADWSKVFPYWLIATFDDEVIGCIQVMPAKPVGWCEFLYVKQGISIKLRVIALRKLMAQGMATVGLNGAAYCACTVDVKNNRHIDVLEKLGTKVSDCSVMAKRFP